MTKHKLMAAILWIASTAVVYATVVNEPGADTGAALLISAFLGANLTIIGFILIKILFKVWGCCPDAIKPHKYREYRQPTTSNVVYGDKAYNDLMRGEPVNLVDQEQKKKVGEASRQWTRQEQRRRRQREFEQQRNDSNDVAIATAAVASSSYSSSSDSGSSFGGSDGGAF